MPVSLPKKRSRAKTADGRHRESGRGRKPRNNWTRLRLDYDALEKAKVLVEIVPYVERPKTAKNPRGYKKDIRVAVLPWSGDSGYLDVRFYVNDKPTGRGILCHWDHAEALISAINASRAEVEHLHKLGVWGRIAPKETGGE